jgi:hypothetical protein
MKRVAHSSHAAYQSASPCDLGASAPHSSEGNAAEAPISNFLQDLEPVFQAKSRVGSLGPSPARSLVDDSHFGGPVMNERTRRDEVVFRSRVLDGSACVDLRFSGSN